MRSLPCLLCLIITGIAQAAVPADIAPKLLEIGRVVAPPATAKIYRPLQPSAPYPGVKVARDVSFGPDPRNVVDIFSAEKGRSGAPVLIYVAGGAGNKIEQVPDGEAFYDNIMLWAVKNGMTGVNVQRRGGQGLAWDDPAKDISTMIQWVQQNIGNYGGNPNRLFIWAHSAGNGPVGNYLGHPELWGPKGVGLKGAILMSGNFNVLPVRTAPQAGRGGPGAPGAPAGAPPDGRGRGGQPPVDPATQLARSNLPELEKTKVALFLAAAELDPPTTVEFEGLLHDELCKAGSSHCPAQLIAKDHSHMSEVFSINTADDSVSGPILKWMKKVK